MRNSGWKLAALAQSLSREGLIELLKSTGVYLDGHFLLTSGRHSPNFLLLSQLFQHPWATELLCRQLARELASLDIETVAGPAVGGVILSYELARALGTRAIFAEKENGRMAFKRGFAIAPGEKVLVVEDAVTTGGSVRLVVDALRELGADVVAVGAVVDRSGSRVNFGVPFKAVLTLDIPSYAPEECPLCREGVPVIKPKGRTGSTAEGR